MNRWLLLIIVTIMLAASQALAGGVLELTPSDAGPYQPGDFVDVGVNIINTETTGITVLATALNFESSDSAIMFPEEFIFNTVNPYVIDATMPLVSETYFPPLFSGESASLIHIGASEAYQIGHVVIQLPDVIGDFTLDALNYTEDGSRISSLINFTRDGFTFPDYLASFDGSLVGGQATFSVVPEPAMFALIAVGGLMFLGLNVRRR